MARQEASAQHTAASLIQHTSAACSRRATLGEGHRWQEGNLHVIVSAREGSNYQWRMTMAPPAPEKDQEYFGIVLSW